MTEVSPRKKGIQPESTINGRTISADRSIKMFDLSNVELVGPIVAECKPGED